MMSDAKSRRSGATVARRYCAYAVQVCAAAVTDLRRRSGSVARQVDKQTGQGSMWVCVART